MNRQLRIENNGLISGDMNMKHLLALGDAFGTRCRRVVLGRIQDGPSACARMEGLAAALIAAGAEVFDAGELPLPILRFCARENGADGMAALGEKRWLLLQSENSAAWRQDFRAGIPHAVPAEDLLPESSAVRPMNAYFRKLAAAVETETIRAKNFPVLLNASGAAEKFAEALLAKLGCRRVTETEPAAIGFDFSPDGDAVRVRGTAGRVYEPCRTMQLIFEHLLEAYPGTAVLGGPDAITLDIAAGCGCECVECPPEESEVLTKMRETGAALGGIPYSGAVIWKKIQPCADGFAAMTLILEMLALSGETPDAIIQSL